MNRSKSGHPEWTDRLSDYMDGELDPSRHAEVEAHLTECGPCRRVLAELRAVKDRAAALGAVEPSRDLWTGIAATIEAAPAERRGGASVIELPTSGGHAPEDRAPGVRDDALAPHRFTLSSHQLAAASVALVVASSLLTMAVRARPEAGARPADVVEGVIQPVAGAPATPPELARELASLERTVAEGRDALDPNTVRVLERNLGIIERAIEDSRRALAQDPDNDFLAEHLRRVYERKLEYLRDAARVAERSG